MYSSTIGAGIKKQLKMTTYEKIQTLESSNFKNELRLLSHFMSIDGAYYYLIGQYFPEIDTETAISEEFNSPIWEHFNIEW